MRKLKKTKKYFQFGKHFALSTLESLNSTKEHNNKFGCDNHTDKIIKIQIIENGFLKKT
jgi:hypothetical protein